MRRTITIVGAILALTGCSQIHAPEPDAGSDAGPIAMDDAAMPEVDAGFDAGSDAGPEVVRDINRTMACAYMANILGDCSMECPYVGERCSRERAIACWTAVRDYAYAPELDCPGFADALVAAPECDEVCE